MDVHHVPRALPWADISLPLWGALIQIVIILPKLKYIHINGFLGDFSLLCPVKTFMSAFLLSYLPTNDCYDIYKYKKQLIEAAKRYI